MISRCPVTHEMCDQPKNCPDLCTKSPFPGWPVESIADTAGALSAEREAFDTWAQNIRMDCSIGLNGHYLDSATAYAFAAWRERAALLADTAGANSEAEQYKRMFLAACSDLGLINEALGLDPNDGGADPILSAIAELKAERDQWVDAQYAAPPAPSVADASRDAIYRKALAMGDDPGVLGGAAEAPSVADAAGANTYSGFCAAFFASNRRNATEQEIFDAGVRAGIARVSPAIDTAGAKPVNGIPATLRHDEGAIARCSYCGRYSLDPKTLSNRQPKCECGKEHGWSGSFKKPDGDAQWSGAAPPAPSVADAAGASEDARDAARYRWLRDRRVEFDLMGLHSYYATKLWQELGERFDWDDAIDAAIEKESGND